MVDTTSNGGNEPREPMHHSYRFLVRTVVIIQIAFNQVQASRQVIKLTAQQRFGIRLIRAAHEAEREVKHIVKERLM